MSTFHNLLTNLPGVSAFCTLAGFNICTYTGAEANPTDMELLEKHTGISRNRMFFPVQTHSAIVKQVPNDLQGVDAVIATGHGTLIGVHTADCLPLLLADTSAEVIAAVHCGWRGTVAGIVKNTITEMIALGAQPEHIAAAFGPHICPECFEVGEEVAMQFPDNAVIRISGKKPRVNLAEAVTSQLKSLGITNIENPGLCSKCNPDFYSVRRQGYNLTHRTLSAIHLNNSTKNQF